VIVIYLTVQKRWIGEDGQRWKTIISSDGRGYYAYLPAVLLFGDLSFSKVIEIDTKAFPNSEQAAGFILRDGDKKFNKYFPGLAILWPPFFLIAWLLSFLTGQEINGYSYYFQIMVSIAGMCYVFLGLWLARKLLLLEKIPDVVVALTIPCLFFGTNLSYYTIMEPALSHIYSFALIAGFLFTLKKAFLKDNPHAALLPAFLFGLTMMVRPINMLVILAVPFIAGSWDVLMKFFRNIRNSPITGIFAIALAVLPPAVIPVMMFLQTGNPFLWSYRGEGFYLNDPQIINVLFSFRKGFFIYTPLCFLALLALPVIFRASRFRFFSFLILFSTITYFISCWWQWYFGDSFGHRAFIDFYAVFFMLFGLLLMNVNRFITKAVIIAVALFFIYLQQVQAYQYERFIMHHDVMTWEKYKHIFLKTGRYYRFVLKGNKDAPLYGKLLELKKFANDFESNQPFWDEESIVRSTDAHEGLYSSLCSSVEYGNGMTFPLDSLWQGERQKYVVASLWWKELEENACRDASLVVAMDDTSGKLVYWKALVLREVPSGKFYEWKKTDWQFYFPAMAPAGNKLKVYIWNPERKQFLIDDFQMTFYKALPRNNPIGIHSEKLRQ